MAYDEELADRIRQQLERDPEVTEMKMFGGLAFLVGGNMAIAASGQGGALVRVDPTASNEILAATNAQPMEMRGTKMAGWLQVPDEDLRTEKQLTKWIKLGVTFARSLPPKR